MTLPVTLTLSPEAEAKLRESLARKDGESARQVLAEAVAPTVENLLSHPVVEEREPKSPDELNDEEFEALADQLVIEMDRLIPPGTPPLSDYALSQEGFNTDLSLSKSLFEEVETVAREMELSRSRLFVMAVKDFIERYRTRRLVEQMNLAYQDGPDEEEQKWLMHAKQSYRRLLEAEEAENGDQSW